MAIRQVISELIYKLTADDKQLTESLKKAETQANKLADSFIATGKTLTLGLTVPLLGAGAAAVKLASDTGESLNAVNVVFGESSNIITAWGENATTQAGLTAAEFNQASAVIGAGLINQGLATDEAAERTTELVSRAADLASIFNTDVNDALTAIGAGLRGESEPLRRYAVTLSEAAVNARAVGLGLAESENDVSQYAKTQARLAILFEQTNRFAGDFVNTSDDLANSTRILTADVKEAAAELGEQLLPIVLEGVTFLRDLVSQFRELDEQQQRTILVVAGLAAALGPLLIAIGSTIRAVSTLRTAFLALGAAGGPITLAVVGITALVAGVTALVERQKRVKEQKIEDTYADIAESAGLTSRQIRELGDSFVVLNAEMGASTEDVIEIAKEQAAETGKTVDEVLALASAYDGINDTVLTLIQDARELTRIESARESASTIYEESRRRRSEDLIAARRQAAEQQERETEAIAEALRLEEERVRKVVEEREEAEEITRRAIRETQRLRQVGLLDEEAQVQELIDIYEEELRTLVEIGYTQDQGGINGQKRVKELQAAITTLRLSAVDDTFTMYDAINQASAESRDARLEHELELQEQRRIANDEAIAQLEEQKALTLDFVNTGLSPLIQGFSDVGEAIVNNEDAWGALAKAGLKSLSALIRALGDQLAAYAAEGIVRAIFGDPRGIPAAIAAGAGAAAAYTAAGVIDANAAKFAQGGSFTVPDGFANDSFPLAFAQSGERVSVETPGQAAVNDMGGVNLHVGTLVASPESLRELDRMLYKYGGVNRIARGTNG